MPRYDMTMATRQKSPSGAVVNEMAMREHSLSCDPCSMIPKCEAAAANKKTIKCTFLSAVAFNLFFMKVLTCGVN